MIENEGRTNKKRNGGISDKFFNTATLNSMNYGAISSLGSKQNPVKS